MAHDFEAAAEQEPEQRTQYLLEAAQTWRTVGDYQRAHGLFGQLLEEDGPASRRVRVEYAAMLVDLDEREHAVVLLDQVWNTAHLDPLDALLAGQLRETSLREPERALPWFDRGISTMLTPDSSPTVEEVSSNRVLLDLFHSRRRVRNTLDKPDDDWDELARAGQQAAPWTGTEDTDELADFDEVLSGSTSQRQDAWLYWVLEEFADYHRRWMQYDANVPSLVRAHIRHRRELEQQLRSESDTSSQMLVYGDVQHYAEFVSIYGLNPIAPETHMEYATVRAEEGNALRWPPDSDDHCWCVSGRQYRWCCGHPDFLA